MKVKSKDTSGKPDCEKYEPMALAEGNTTEAEPDQTQQQALSSLALERVLRRHGLLSESTVMPRMTSPGGLPEFHEDFPSLGANGSQF